MYSMLATIFQTWNVWHSNSNRFYTGVLWNFWSDTRRLLLVSMFAYWLRGLGSISNFVVIFFSSGYLLTSKNLKIKIYKTIILPVVLYGCETWSLTLREGTRLRVFENRILRRIFGPKRDENGEWRTKLN